ncbi:hypothetical protein [Dyella flagellata]|uniref:Uncharacterized protein n=1 Tax=Dyella flagellata TaxID=1867833 RepID=A0ABQ5X7Q5_9GAMM|nr:hypothetical protein [Dyella flagellata]GLQ87234.1 hypothetical protein GCM10007898_08000 [Dyella flagellata]
MDLNTLLGLLGEVPESERARPILNHFPSLHTTVAELPGDVDTLTETLLSCRDYGFEARLASSGEIATVYLMGAGNEGFGEFPYPLVEGLRFGARRDAVEAKFGRPHWSRSNNETPVVLNGAGEAIRYDLKSYALYFQFDKRNGQLQQVAAESTIGLSAQHH